MHIFSLRKFSKWIHVIPKYGMKQLFYQKSFSITPKPKNI
jgi:hypothetical protein